jgi:hypothetical protein
MLLFVVCGYNFMCVMFNRWFFCVNHMWHMVLLHCAKVSVKITLYVSQDQTSKHKRYLCATGSILDKLLTCEKTDRWNSTDRILHVFQSFYQHGDLKKNYDVGRNRSGVFLFVVRVYN